MEAESTRCKALTKSGNRCRNMARIGSQYCHTHAELDHAGAQPVTLPATPPAPVNRQNVAASTSGGQTRTDIVVRMGGIQLTTDVGLDLLVHEVGQLANELERLLPAFVPRKFAPSQLVGMFNQSVGRYLPETQRELMKDVERNLEDATFRDFADPQTWQGLWTLISYSVQAQVAMTQQALSERLTAYLGADLFEQIKGNLEGTTPQDLIDPETWKGLLYLVYYILQLEAHEVKQLMAPSGTVEPSAAVQPQAAANQETA